MGRTLLIMLLLLVGCGQDNNGPVSNAHVLYVTSYHGEHGFEKVYDYTRQCVLANGVMMNDAPPKSVYMVNGLFLCDGIETSGCYYNGIWLTRTTSAAEHLTYAHELIHHFTRVGKTEESSAIFQACDPLLNCKAYFDIIAFYYQP